MYSDCIHVQMYMIVQLYMYMYIVQYSVDLVHGLKIKGEDSVHSQYSHVVVETAS